MPDLHDNRTAALLESYGEHVFSPNTLTRIQAQPVYDNARRTVKFVRYTLDVTSHVLAKVNSTTEVEVEGLWKQLSRRGDTLRLTGIGLGQIVVNDPEAIPIDNPETNFFRDVSYGPHPKVVQLTPLGFNKAWFLHWTCEFNIVQCAEGTAHDQDQIMAFTYTWNVSQDEHGFSTRTISGEIEIPATLMVVNNVPEKTPPDVADAYWDRLIRSIPVPFGFLRRHDRALSEDRRTLRFNIVDRELPPQGFVKGATLWDASQEAGSTLNDGFTTWTSSVEATYYAVRDRPKRDLYDHFIALVASKIGENPVPGKIKKKGFIPLGFNVRDHLNGRDVTFSYRWYYVRPWAEALEASGMFRPVPNASWIEWFNFAQNTSLSPRGSAKLAYSPANDSVIDLCDPPQLRLPQGGTLNDEPAAAEGAIIPGPAKVTLIPDGGKVLPASGDNLDRSGAIALPDADDSWVAYECAIYFFGDQGVVTGSPLPTGDFFTEGQASQFPGTGDGFSSSGGDFGGQDKEQFFTDSPLPSGNINLDEGIPAQVTIPIPETPGVRNIIQQRVLPTSYARLRGRALRVGYPISAPQLLAAAGSRAILLKPQFVQEFVGNFGLPVVYAEWDMLYILPDTSQESLPIPSNPVLGL